MLWLAAGAPFLLPMILADAPSPLGDPSGDIARYILGYGPVGVVAVALAYVLYRGLFVRASSADQARAEAVALARDDLLKENERLIAEKDRAEAQRDEQLRFAQTQLVPIVTSFLGTTTALIPLLQDLVNMREELRRRAGR